MVLPVTQGMSILEYTQDYAEILEVDRERPRPSENDHKATWSIIALRIILQAYKLDGLIPSAYPWC